MSDLQKYINKRKLRDPEFAEGFDTGYEQFKIGVMLKQAREEAGLTQEQLAEKLHTKKSAISRIDNLVKSRFWDGKEKSSRSRRANSEECSVLSCT